MVKVDTSTVEEVRDRLASETKRKLAKWQAVQEMPVAGGSRKRLQSLVAKAGNKSKKAQEEIEARREAKKAAQASKRK